MYQSICQDPKMKFVVCFVLFAVVGLTFGEECVDEADCDHVTCPEADYTLDCVHGDCTCTHVSATCDHADDCADVDEFCREQWHCVDGQCRCGFGFGGGEIGEPGEPGGPGAGGPAGGGPGK